MTSTTFSFPDGQVTYSDVSSIKRGDVVAPDGAVAIVIGPNVTSDGQCLQGLADLVRLVSGDAASSAHFVTALKSALLTVASMEGCKEVFSHGHVTEDNTPTVNVRVQTPAEFQQNRPLPRRSTVHGPERMKRFVLDSATWITADELSRMAGYTNVNTSAQPNKWKKESKIFAVSQGGRDLFPTYALGDDGKPLPALKEVLSVFHGKKSDWAIATWFASDNGWLGGSAPALKLSSDPSAVLQAAKMEVEPSGHG